MNLATARSSEEPAAGDRVPDRSGKRLQGLSLSLLILRAGPLLKFFSFWRWLSV